MQPQPDLDMLHGSGYRPLTEVLKPSESCVPADVLERNIRSALKRRLQWVTPCAPHDGIMALCAGGPSLADNLQKVKELYWRDGAMIVAVNGAVQYLHKQGVKVWGCVLLDPQPVLAKQIEKVPGVTWLVASQCHPDVFAMLPKRDIFLWHAEADCKVQELALEYRPEFPLIPGGSTAALRAIPLGHCMGFRRFEVFGLDGSFKNDRHHAYDQPEDDGMPIKVVKPEWSEEAFVTRRDYARQADEFKTLYLQLDELRGLSRVQIRVHGDGLIPCIWKHLEERKKNG